MRTQKSHNEIARQAKCKTYPLNSLQQTLTPPSPPIPVVQSRIQGFGSSEGGGGNSNEYRGGATLNPPSSASNTFSASSASSRFSGTSGSGVPSYGPSSSSRGGSNAEAFSNGSGSVNPSRMVGFGSDSSYKPGQQTSSGGGRGGAVSTGPGIGVGEMMSSLGSNVNSFIRNQFNAEVGGRRLVVCLLTCLAQDLHCKLQPSVQTQCVCACLVHATVFLLHCPLQGFMSDLWS